MSKFNAHSLQKRLRDMGLTLVHTKGDGDCLLHALMKSTKYKGTTKQLRKDLVNIVKDIHTKVLPDMGPYSLAKPDFVIRKTVSYPIKTWADYFKQMAVHGTWCDEHMILAASIKFKRPIYIIQSATEYVAHHCPPPNWNIQMENKRLIIANETGQHFSAVSPIGVRRKLRRKSSNKALKERIRQKWIGIMDNKGIHQETLTQWHTACANGIYKRVLKRQIKPQYVIGHIKNMVSKLPRMTPKHGAKFLPCDAAIAPILEALLKSNQKYKTCKLT